jgi:hypothetical protein
MKTLELRDPSTMNMNLKYVKVTNPENEKEFIYVEENVLNTILSQMDTGLSGFFGDLWNTVKTVASGVVKTGTELVGTAVKGVITGFVGGGVSGTPSATSTQANGQPTILISNPAGSPAPAAIAPAAPSNAPLYIGLAAAAAIGFVAFSSKRK